MLHVTQSLTTGHALSLARYTEDSLKEKALFWPKPVQLLVSHVFRKSRSCALVEKIPILIDAGSCEKQWTENEIAKDCHGWLGCSPIWTSIFDDFFQHLWLYIGNNTANVVFQKVKRLWLIRIDQ
ncbi:hypothetical protein TNCV_3613311 [Trichonephila clavipes]|uniref:Uncharacterized protein n=1 Tax=Trichonephila clavipes TaxID=2585209 RepID=A0A8X6SRX2_TRICX|nr:hypothetical protein TNCV_3613311 [Trichonephila clavipes]